MATNELSGINTASFDLDEFSRLAPSLAATFSAADPFPHVIVDGLLLAGTEILASFPDATWTGWSGVGDAYQTGKLSCGDISLIPEILGHLIDEMSSPKFLRSLELITGISKLIPDPYLTGGGLHMSTAGGVLAPHTDFHIYERLDLYRRINVLLYLNPDWSESDGGCLELFSSDNDSQVTVVPTWGRMVIFATDDNSIHGFPDPVKGSRHRRSIALYYYTALESRTFSGDTTTYWRQHGDQKGTTRRVRIEFYKLLINASKAFALFAHLVNPNQGMSWWKARSQRVGRKEDGLR